MHVLSLMKNDLILTATVIVNYHIESKEHGKQINHVSVNEQVFFKVERLTCSEGYGPYDP